MLAILCPADLAGAEAGGRKDEKLIHKWFPLTYASELVIPGYQYKSKPKQITFSIFF
jgi:hypothetical protein